MLAYLISSPLHPSHEENHTGNACEATDIVYTLQGLAPAQAIRVRPGRRKVEYRRQNETDESPQGTEETDVSPAGIVSNQLAPQDRRAKRHNGKDECADVDAPLRGWRQLGRGRQCCELVDASSDAREHHSSLYRVSYGLNKLLLKQISVPINMFISFAVEQMIMPITMKDAPRLWSAWELACHQHKSDLPMRATYRRPSRSDMDPTNGQIPAKESRLARTNHTHRSVPPRSP